MTLLLNIFEKVVLSPVTIWGRYVLSEKESGLRSSTTVLAMVR